MPELDHELSKRPERMPVEVFYDLLNGVGNHEAKLLVTAIIASHPDYWFTATKLKNELTSRQGPHPAWPQLPMTTFLYCKNSLEPIGAVVKGRVAGDYREVDAYKASESGQKYGLALAGELLEWSLEHPEISLQQIFGSTSTSGAVRSPETRFHVLEAILTHPSGTPSEKEIADSLSDLHSEKGIEQNLNFMKHYGHIEVASTPSDEFDPLVKITRPTSDRNFYEITDAAKAVRKAINKLYEQGETEVSFSKLYEEAVSANPGVDPTKIRDSVVKGINSTSTLHPELSVVDRGGIVRDKSIVRLAQTSRTALEDLINRLESLADTEDLGLSRQKAVKIIDDPIKVNALMEKARISSPSHRGAVEGGTQDLYDRVLRIASTMGKLSNKDIRDQLKYEGRPLSPGRTGQILRELVSQGQLKALTAEPDAQRKRKITVYELAEAEQ